MILDIVIDLSNGLPTFQPIDTSNHDIKAFQHLSVQTFQPMF